ncbi:hypothetical protein OsJ_29836 [Oryza sativa Japonica Group]|uniref:Uncharacterized protein n=1 Tax=Oryza sativa subsp. japonica TaxID=39947 RepID=A3C054_ORYSJ|nr:hypothetical protein OsJ_29836 [Oryza sativa Japonica Group]
MDEQRVAASAAYLLAVLVLSLVVSDLSSAGVAPTPPEVLSSPAAAGEAEALLAVKAAPHDTANVLADWNAGFGVSDGGPWQLEHGSLFRGRPYGREHRDAEVGVGAVLGLRHRSLPRRQRRPPRAETRSG